MNESETRAEYIDPKLKDAGWGEVEGSKILREFRITIFAHGYNHMGLPF
jgi:type I restriction enzyme R subunit